MPEVNPLDPAAMADGDTAVPDPPWGALLLVCWLVGGATGLLALVWSFGAARTNFEQATLPQGTASIMASINGDRIHCSDARDIEECLTGARRRGAQSVAIWLGNSQVHAVNQLQPGQTNAPPILFEALKPRGLDFLTFSQPNANLQEHAALFAYLCSKLPVRTLVLPLVFDDMREDGLRQGIVSLLDDAPTRLLLESSAPGRQLLAKALPAAKANDTAGIAATIQESVERKLTRSLATHSEFWRARPELRGRLFLGLYRLRNAVLGIEASTRRKMIPSRYQANLDALRFLLQLAAERHAKVILYIAPIRQDLPVPYVIQEYEEFKGLGQRLAHEYGARFENFESLVPPQFWGMKEATSAGAGLEVDYMHFQAAGHELLAEALINALRASANEEPPTR